MLLSRFSILFWVPLYALIYAIQEKRKALTVSGLVLLGIFLLFILPFLPFEMDFLKKMIGYYNEFAASEANAWTWQEMKDGKPQKLFKGVGMAIQFYANQDLSVMERIHALKSTHLWVSIGSVLFLTIIYFLTRTKIAMHHFLLASAKFYLVLFYSFIYVPYSYLFMVPVFFSIVLLSNINFPHSRQVKT